MRILLIHNLAPWDRRAGGGQHVQHELAVNAVAAGHDARVLYLGDAAGAPDTPYSVVWVRERRRLVANAVAVARSVRRLMSDWRPDVVHGSAAEAGFLPLVLPPGVGLVATSHHPNPPPLPPTLQLTVPASFAAARRLQNPLLEARLLRGAHRVVAVSRWGAETLHQRGYLPATRPIAVVPNGVGPEWFASSPPSSASSAHRSILVVGRVERTKGWDVLLDALGRPDAPRESRVAFAGTGPDQAELARRAAELGLGDRVEPLGRLAPPALRARLAQTSVLVLPSRQENYPLVLLEAMAAGVPVVATRVGGVGEMIEDGRSGLLVPPDDPAALAAALNRVIGDPELRERLVTEGRAVAERHRWASMVSRLVEQYALARELARTVPRPEASPVSSLFRRRAAGAAAAQAPRATVTTPPREVARIALVRPGRLGDLLLVDPLVAALEERHPDARIELITDASDGIPPWMTGPRVTHRKLTLRRGPDAWRRPDDPERAASLASLARDWAVAPPDLLLFAVDLTEPIFREIAARMIAAAPHSWRAGLAQRGGVIAELNAAVAPTSEDAHEIERLLALGAAAGASARFRLPRIPEARSPLPPWDGPTLVVHPGASRPTKQWPLARWGELATLLAHSGFRTVAVGAPEDRAHVSSLGMAFDERALLDRVGSLDLPGLAAAIAGADAFAGNDSFPFHLAVSAGIPSVALVGPGAARWTRYPAAHATVLREPVICSPRFGEECPVYTTCPHGACMQSIRVETVADTVLRTLRVG